MKQLTLSLLFSLFIILSFGQDFSNRVKIDSNLSLALPCIYNTKNLNGVNVYSCQLEYISLGAVVSKNQFKIKSQEDFDICIKGVLKGCTNNTPALKNYQIKLIDTSLGGTRGKFIRFFNGKGTYPLSELQMFITIQDSTIYIVEAGLANDKQLTKQQSDSFFHSVRFTGKMPIVQGSLSTFTAFIKLMIVPLLVLAVIIFIILKLTQRI